MSNIVQFKDKYFIKSEKISIFPCAFRGTKKVTLTSGQSAGVVPTEKTIAFQPTARAFTEENYTNSYAKLGTLDSYLISTAAPTSIDGDFDINVVIAGYAITLKLTKEDVEFLGGNPLTNVCTTVLTTPRYLVVRTYDKEMYSYTTKNNETIKATTKMIQPAVTPDGGSDDMTLDYLINSSSNTNIFLGLEIADDIPDGANVTTLQIVKYLGTTSSTSTQTYKWLYESQPIFNNIRTGKGFNSIINLGDSVTDACNAVGDYSAALGKATTVLGEASLAVGDTSNVEGDYAVAFGRNTEAIGNGAIAAGDHSKATGNNAIAIGEYVTAEHNDSFVTGKRTQSDTNCQAVFGKYNEISSNNAFTIGNGSSLTNRQNLVNIALNGNVDIQGEENTISIGTRKHKAAICISNTTTVDNLGNIYTSGNLDINDILNVCVDAQNMTLNGSFHETNTFTLGSDKSAPEVKFDTTNKAITTTYNIVNVGNSTNYLKMDANAIVTSKSLTVNNTANITGNVDIDSNLTVDGQIDLSGLIHTYKTTDGTKILINQTSQDPVNLPRTMYVSGGATIAGNVKINDLEVTTVNSKPKLTFNTDYVVVDPASAVTTIKNTLNVTERVNVTNELNVATTTISADCINLADKVVMDVTNSAIDIADTCLVSFGTGNTTITENSVSTTGVSTSTVTATGKCILGNVTIEGANTTGKGIDSFSLTASTANDPYLTANAAGLTVGGKINTATITSTELSIPSLISFKTDGSAITTTKLTVSGGIVANDYDTPSDIRLKENIVSYTAPGNILDLDVKKFNYISDPNKKEHIGCIAQELQQICPELVDTDENGYLSVKESKLVYLLLDEVKKLRKEIDILKEN